jgi:hypothetical protein
LLGLPTACRPEYSFFGLRRRIFLLGLSLAGLAAFVLSADVVSLSFDAAAFREAFNASAAKGRLILIVAPT